MSKTQEALRVERALKLALEALSPWTGEDANHTEQYAAYNAIHSALAEQPAQQQEPDLRFANPIGLTPDQKEIQRKQLLAQQQEPVAWRDHVEQRLLTWRQSFVNKSGDQLALDDFMDKRSLDDLIDFVCSEYTSPPASKPWVELTDEDFNTNMFSITSFGVCDIACMKSIAKDVEAKLREKNT